MASSITEVQPCKSTPTVRVLHLATMLSSGGAERWIVDLCEGAQSESLAMDIAVLQPVEGLFARKARELGIRVFHCAPNRNPLIFIRNLRRLLREHGPYDAIHCHIHAAGSYAVLAAWLEGIPARVVHSHNVVQNSSRSLARRVYIVIARALIRRFATAGIAPSAIAAEDLLGSSWRADARWSVLPCGINLAPFRAPITTASSRPALGIPAGAFVLGSVGRLTSDKNSEFLVEILAAVLPRVPQAYLLLIGEGSLRGLLVSKAQQGGFGDRLVLPGTRSDVPAILRNVMDVFVFPSPPPPYGNEALAIAVVEAQAAGLPTVISDGIPLEAIIVPELVARIPAAESAATWAETAVGQARRRETGTSDRALQLVEQSNFNRVQSLKILARLYAPNRAG